MSIRKEFIYKIGKEDRIQIGTQIDHSKFNPRMAKGGFTVKGQKAIGLGWLI
jgi:hypothetical protein